MKSKKVFIVTESGVPTGAYASVRAACGDQGWSYWNVSRRIPLQGYYARGGRRLTPLLLIAVEGRGSASRFEGKEKGPL